jgi:aspartyl-tRNA(Asn)/glutamyl-tRNA(Gln) amidotransferase subunit B
MQEGSLRVDANVNLHIDSPQGKVATPIVEIKNMNSFRAVERALDYEAERQWREWQETGRKLGDAPKQTRGWDDVAGLTRGQRSKEESSDYRYFPDPDLAPVTVDQKQVDKVRADLGELPAALRGRLESEYSLSAYDADVLVNQGQPIVDYFLMVAKTCGDGKAAANWVTQDVLRVLKERNWELSELVQNRGINAEWLGELIRRTLTKELSRAQAKQVFDEAVRTEKPNYTFPIDFSAVLDAQISDLGIAAVDESELVALCEKLLAANPKTISDVKSGKVQAIGALIGQAKRLNPNVDPSRIREICLQLIENAHP